MAAGEGEVEGCVVEGYSVRSARAARGEPEREEVDALQEVQGDRAFFARGEDAEGLLEEPGYRDDAEKDPDGDGRGVGPAPDGAG